MKKEREREEENDFNWKPEEGETTVGSLVAWPKLEVEALT